MTDVIVKRFYDEPLAQASYLVGCAATGEALVVDPHRDVQEYLDAAAAEDLRITHVTETHIHADFVSGLRELVARTGARAYVSDEGGADWRYAFADAIQAVRLRDGDSWMVGNVRVQALHTPGHTPEHMTFLITDTAGADQPMGAFTGDFIFAGDVGRPDLLEKAAGVSGTMAAAARQLFASLQRFRALPDWLQLWPGHGAGSACGKALGAVPSTTLGYEKLFNWAFSIDTESEFVSSVLAGQPEPPKYFAEMKRVNRDGPRVLGGLPLPQQQGVAELQAALAAGAVVVDARPWQEYRAGYIPGTLNIPFNRSFTTWAGWLIPYDRDFFVIMPDHGALPGVARDLAMIGLDRFAGCFDADVVREWQRAGGETAQLTEMTQAQLKERMDAGDVYVLDVRGQSEWEAAHLPGVPNIPLGYLAERIAEVPRDRPVALHCKSGSRSAIATSLLALHGVPDARNVAGGFDGWVAAGHRVETESVVAAGQTGAGALT